LKVFASVLPFIAFLLPVYVAFRKSFQLDEFVYAHWGWLSSQGQRIGVDFFVTHFPLIACLTSLPFRVVGSAPTAIFYDRLLMIPFFALTCLAAFAINSRISLTTGVLSPVFLCLNSVLIVHITEIRPDSLAIALYLAASAILLWPKKIRIPISFCGGMLLVLAVLSSEKTLVYGPAIFVALGFGFHGSSAEERTEIKRHLGIAASGAAATVSGVILYLLHGRALHFWASVWWPYATLHERSYPASRWAGLRLLRTLCTYEPVLILLAAWAVIKIAGNIKGNRDRSLSTNPAQVFLVALLATSIVSILIQKAPMPYSVIPVAAATSMLAAAGLTYIWEDIKARQQGRSRSFLIAGTTVALLLFVATNVWAQFKIASRGNSGQMQTLQLLAKISTPSECVYDNSGGAIARPHADDRFYQTDLPTRIVQADILQQEIPAAIQNRGCALMLQDGRTLTLPEPLQEFLAENYFSYTDDISVWGKSFVSQEDFLHSESFSAVATGKYFVWPSMVNKQLEIAIDGTELKSQTFGLTKGDHTVEFRGRGAFYILWLPKNTQPFEPQKAIQPRLLEM
jgi:hypothetical protein